MSGTENTDGLEADSIAFEYVVGTLTGSARADFETKLLHDKDEQRKVQYWEEQLMSLNSTALTREPVKNNWAAIEKRINPTRQISPASTTPLLTRFLWFPWAITAVFALLLMINTIVPQSILDNDSTTLPVDYIAVMTDNDGNAALSTVAQGDSKRLWLQWGENALAINQDYQLWAISRSDGETRSISVIADKDVTLLELSEAQWRLIKDSKSLLLTAEDEGGSAIDEPSEVLVAQGICVRLAQANKDA